MIESVMFLSTAHIPQHTDTAIIEEALWDLRSHGVRDGKDHGGMPATMLFPCGDGFYGYLVWCDAGFVDMKAEEKHPELQRVIEYAHDHGCKWIRFDCDGPILPELPTFEWNEKSGYWHRDGRIADGESTAPSLDECADCGGSTAEGTPDPHVCNTK